MGPGDEVEFTEGGRRMRGWIESISHTAREFVLTVRSADGKTFRHPRVGFDRCRVPYESPLPAAPVGINQKVRVKGTHPMAGRVGTVTTLSPVDAQVDLGDGSMPWVPFEELGGAEVVSAVLAFRPGLLVCKEDDPGRRGVLDCQVELIKDAWFVKWDDGCRTWCFERKLRILHEANPSESPNSSPEPTPEQRETLLLAAAGMTERESRPKEPRCEAWKAEIVLGAADWESEIPSRGVTFFTTPDGHLQVDATDADEAVGTITFARPHCREAVVVMLNARLKAKRLDDAAGIVAPEEVIQP